MRKVEELPEIKSGLTWATDEKVYTIIEVNEDEVQYLVNNQGKSAKIKTKHIDKIVKMLLKASDIFVDTKTSDKKVQVKGVLINAHELTLRDLPLEQPLSNGSETIYCFSLNGKDNKMLIGQTRMDTDPIWMPINDVFKVVSKEFLTSISQGSVDFESEPDPKIIQKKALEAIKNLKNK
jgi:hypothetical protein